MTKRFRVRIFPRKEILEALERFRSYYDQCGVGEGLPLGKMFQRMRIITNEYWKLLGDPASYGLTSYAYAGQTSAPK